MIIVPPTPIRLLSWFLLTKWKIMKHSSYMSFSFFYDSWQMVFFIIFNIHHSGGVNVFSKKNAGLYHKVRDLFDTFLSKFIKNIQLRKLFYPNIPCIILDFISSIEFKILLGYLQWLISTAIHIVTSFSFVIFTFILFSTFRPAKRMAYFWSFIFFKNFRREVSKFPNLR